MLEDRHRVDVTEVVEDTVEERQSVGLGLPVLEPLGHWDTEGETEEVRHRLGEPEEVLE